MSKTHSVHLAIKSLLLTVVPLQPDLEPFEIKVDFNQFNERNLKLVFKHTHHWKQVFEGHSPVYPPQFR